MPAIEIKEKCITLNVQELNPEGKETLVLLHGMFGNLSQFYLTLGPELSKYYRVIMYDLRSHGRSSRQADGYDLHSLAEDLRCLLDTLGINSVNLLGYSYGSLVAIKFALLYQYRVKKLIAVEVPPKPEFPYKAKGTYSFNDFLGFAWTLPENVRNNFLRSDRQIKTTFQMYEYVHNHTSFVDDANKEHEFTKDDYNKLTIPVMLMYGNGSICIPELNRICNWIKNVQVVKLDGDHGFFMHKQKESALEIRKFLTDGFNNKEPITDLQFKSDSA